MGSVTAEWSQCGASWVVEWLFGSLLINSTFGNELVILWGGVSHAQSEAYWDTRKLPIAALREPLRKAEPMPLGIFPKDTGWVRLQFLPLQNLEKGREIGPKN